MKQWITLISWPLAVVICILIVAYCIAPELVSGQGSSLNGLTRAALQAGTFTLSGIYNFATGVRLPASSTAAPGSGGFLKKDADTGCWQEWKDGTLGWQLCSNRVIPPDCANQPVLEFGAFCKNQTTGEVLMNTGSGLVALTGAAR